jgi:hypothetical protein
VTQTYKFVGNEINGSKDTTMVTPASSEVPRGTNQYATSFLESGKEMGKKEVK